VFARRLRAVLRRLRSTKRSSWRSPGLRGIFTRLFIFTQRISY